MRRATSLALGLLLVFGPALSGQGHVHATAPEQGPGGVHVDHLHSDSGRHAHDARHSDTALHSHSAEHSHPSHHTHPASAPGLVADHSGDDAIALNLAGSEARPKRELPAQIPPTLDGGSPLADIGPAHDPTQPPPPLTAPKRQPPGRAPPA